MWNRTWNLLDHAFFGPHTRADGPGPATLRLLRYPYAILRDLIGGELNLRATGLVYATLLALIPALAISIAVLGAFGENEAFESLVLEFFKPLGDAAPRITGRLLEFAENVRSGLVGAVGLALLLWTLVGTVKRMEDSFNFVWRVPRARGLLRRISEYVALLIIGPLVVAAVIGFSRLVMSRVVSYAPVEPTPAFSAVLLGFTPHVFVTLLFTAIYLILPNTRVRLVPAVIGGVAAGVAWVITGKLFTALVVLTTRLTLVYAGFAIVVALLLWTFAGWLILLAGAQLAFYVQNPNYLRLGHAALRLSHREQEQLALEIMLRVGRAHRDGAAPWGIEGLSSALALPGIAVSDVTEQLETAGLLRQTDDGRLFPAREISGITLAQILEAVRSIGVGRLPHRQPPTLAVDRLQEELEVARQDACGGRTLGDLVNSAAAESLNPQSPG